MIISHEYKYLFIEIPLTASWAIHHELCHYYGGVPILHKHATYAEFRKIANDLELNYLVFATVRNPLDKIVSRYHKIRNDQRGVFSNVESIDQLVVDFSDIKKYRYINENRVDFENYFQKYYKRPYSDMINLSSKYIDVTLRFESLQNDFSKLLDTLNIKQVRPLPVINWTRGKTRDFKPFYTPKIIDQAKYIFGLSMRKWDYQFPDSWGDYQPSWSDQLIYYCVNRAKYYYMTRLRYNNSPYAVFLRRLRGHLVR